MPAPEPERQVQFLFNVQRLLSDGSFVATYKFALLLSLADLAVERGDEWTESLSLDTRDLAERFVGLYWRQVLPWVHRGSDMTGRLHQATGPAAAIVNRIGAAHDRFQGSFVRLRRDKVAWDRLLRAVARTIEVMPLWKLQTVGRERLDFLYPNVGRGSLLRLHGEAVYCLRRFRDLIGDMAEGAWVRICDEIGETDLGCLAAEAHSVPGVGGVAWLPTRGDNGMGPVTAMTKALDEVFREAQRLPEAQQDELAVAIRAEIEAERDWENRLAASADALGALADEALGEHRSGRTRPLDPDER